ncbi:ZNF845 [Symbiodinium sp. CCMP2456]|nr:ZNF845 [Symbiodinium sp. CCMP2456]
MEAQHPEVDPPPPPPVERRAPKARGSNRDEREEKVRIVYPRECPHCPKSFPSSTRYHKHVSFHTAAKSFKCDHPGCNKAYKRKVDLEDHKAVHLEVKPFRCTVESCDRSFTTKQSLMSHIGRVHNGLSCTACGLRFRKKAKLQQHWAIVHGAHGAHEADGSEVEPGKCPDCGKTFQHRESLEKCARQMHSSRSEPGLSPWHHEMKDHVKGRVKDGDSDFHKRSARDFSGTCQELVLGRTGASWEDRLQEQKAKKVQAMKIIECPGCNSVGFQGYSWDAPESTPLEFHCLPFCVLFFAWLWASPLIRSIDFQDNGTQRSVGGSELIVMTADLPATKKEQRETIKAATDKGIEKQQVYSPLLALRSAPLLSTSEKQAQRLDERRRDMENKMRSYHIQKSKILEKMRTRDPLFKVEDVSAAKAALAEARRKKQAELQAEEKKRWEHLEECAAKGCHKRQTLQLGEVNVLRWFLLDDVLYDLHNSPSFDERLAKAVEQKTKELKDLEKAQKDRIREAVEAGHNKSAAVSPLSACLRNPPDNMERQREILEERNRTMATAAREYLRKRDEMVERQRKREPLFSGAAVADATSQLEEKARKLKQEMAAEQLKNRQHIVELQNKVLARPMMMEIKYGIAA